MLEDKKITIIGAGSWGSTLGIVLSKTNKISLWTHNKNEYEELNKFKTVSKLKNYKLNKNIAITMDINDAIENSKIIIIAVPTNAFNTIIKLLKQSKIRSNQILISASKGVTTNTLKRPSELLSKAFKKNQIAVLSGPNIALDVLSNSPTISVISTKNKTARDYLQKKLSTENFRIYTNSDIIGVEIAGALKNVIAIGAGLSDGHNFSISTKAALISRGLIEIGRIIEKEGGDSQTLLSAAGIGDLIATCFSTRSRNYQVGFNLAKGKSLTQILHDLGQVAEGVETVKSMVHLAKRHKINTPIANSIYQVIKQPKKQKYILQKLLNRPLPKNELDF